MSSWTVVWGAGLLVVWLLLYWVDTAADDVCRKTVTPTGRRAYVFHQTRRIQSSSRVAGTGLSRWVLTFGCFNDDLYLCKKLESTVGCGWSDHFMNVFVLIFVYKVLYVQFLMIIWNMELWFINVCLYSIGHRTCHFDELVIWVTLFRDNVFLIWFFF